MTNSEMDVIYREARRKALTACPHSDGSLESDLKTVTLFSDLFGLYCRQAVIAKHAAIVQGTEQICFFDAMEV